MLFFLLALKLVTCDECGRRVHAEQARHVEEFDFCKVCFDEIMRLPLENENYNLDIE